MPRANANLLHRSAGGRTARDYTIVVLYDGERTEDEYFRGWKLIVPPSRLNLEHMFVRSGGNVVEAVEAAIRKKKRLKNYAELWCVCDVDDTSQADLSSAHILADNNGIRLCTSNRCFEIWLALHFGFTDRPIANECEAIELIKPYYASYGSPYKTIPFIDLFDKTSDAIQRASRLQNSGVSNPATNVHHLARKLMQNCK